jgi:nickel/cobalt transporter (NicO) family protein
MVAAIVAFAAVLFQASPAVAHPHIFIDATAELTFDAEGRFTGMRHEWTFDEAFSSWSIQGLDTNNDGVTSREEMQGLADEHMRGLSEYSFYTFAGEEATNLVFAYGQNPTLDYENGRTTLRFEVALDQPYRIADTLEIAVNDPDYYVAITFADLSVVTAENLPDGCTLSLEPPSEVSPELQEQLFAVPQDQQIPPELAAALRGTQGAILVRCAGLPAATAADAAQSVAEAPFAGPATPFGGPPPEPGFTMPRTGFLGWVAQQQATFYAALTGALGRLKTDNNAFWVLGTLSFLYGIFHAAGPGHGKVVISSYVLANERQLRRGVLLSFLSSMLQSIVAIVFIGIAAAGLAMTSAAMGDAANWIGIVSYALVALLGLWLIARKLFRFGHDHRRDHQRARAHLYGDDHKHAGRDHDHDHGDDDEHGHGEGHDHEGHDHEGHDHDHGHRHVVTAADTKGDWREQLAVVLAVGLRPCSGALIVLVFALSQNVLLAGIAAVFLMGLGTFITVAVLASAAVGAKGLAGRIAGADSPLAGRIIWWLELLAAVAVFAFGVILLLASF